MGNEQGRPIQEGQLWGEVDDQRIARDSAQLLAHGSFAFLIFIVVPLAQCQDELCVEARTGRQDLAKHRHVAAVGNGAQRGEDQRPAVQLLPGELLIVADLAGVGQRSDVMERRGQLPPWKIEFRT